mmetsp:Transcript_22663/g.48059  ORF Transcript_22663/g.48059 Transcript_22663/m.48059 type:complete len:257 (-) Transcript_22663:265-1035(-)
MEMVHDKVRFLFRPWQQRTGHGANTPLEDHTRVASSIEEGFDGLIIAVRRRHGKGTGIAHDVVHLLFASVFDALLARYVILRLVQNQLKHFLGKHRQCFLLLVQSDLANDSVKIVTLWDGAIQGTIRQCDSESLRRLFCKGGCVGIVERHHLLEIARSFFETTQSHPEFGSLNHDRIFVVELGKYVRLKVFVPLALGKPFSKGLVRGLGRSQCKFLLHFSDNRGCQAVTRAILCFRREGSDYRFVGIQIDGHDGHF